MSRINNKNKEFKILLFSRKTVYENVAFAMEVIGAGNEEIVQDVPQVLERHGLTIAVYEGSIGDRLPIWLGCKSRGAVISLIAQVYIVRVPHLTCSYVVSTSRCTVIAPNK